VVAAAVWGFFTFLGGPAYERLAVLPPANLMNDPEQDYFVQGVHNALISELKKAGATVIARTSVMQYRNTHKPIREIAGELGVDALIEASVFRAADSLEIEALLVDGMTEQYVADPIVRRGEFRNAVALYRELTGAIAFELQAALTPQVEARLASARPVNPEAYEAYLQGSFYWQKATPEDLDVAQRYFELALEEDPSYAPAYEGLAWVWAVRQQMQITHPSEAGPKAKAAAERAVELDSTSAGAYEALAVVKTWTDWDWAGAEAEWRRALELDPNVATARAYYAHFLIIVGHTDEAIPHSERALELDPFNPLLHGLHSMVLEHARRHDEAIAAARNALASQPNLGMARNALQHALVSNGMRDEMLTVQRERMVTDPERMAAFEDGLAEAGYEGAFGRLADLLAARYEESRGMPDPGARSSAASWRGRVFMPLSIAWRYIYAGEYERAIDWIEEAHEIHEPSMPYIGTAPLYDPLRSDPRFQMLLRRMGLLQ
jgi:TolB-like protein